MTTLEEAVGPLVDRQRGGPSGGGSTLRPAAHALIARFARLRVALAGTATVERTVLAGTVSERDGELATVETPIGPIRGLCSGPGETVDVIVRADVVTLHRPDSAPPAADTSARNRFRGTIAALDRGETVATASVAVGESVTLPAIVTMDSVDLLDLEVGSDVVVSFKAAATRIVPRSVPDGE
ncbi:MAG: TOBE domain-containing protein [Halococcoides sp.]